MSFLGLGGRPDMKVTEERSNQQGSFIEFLPCPISCSEHVNISIFNSHSHLKSHRSWHSPALVSFLSPRWPQHHLPSPDFYNTLREVGFYYCNRAPEAVYGIENRSFFLMVSGGWEVQGQVSSEWPGLPRWVRTH